MRDRSKMLSDPLSDLLNLVRARCNFSGRIVAGGDWAQAFENESIIRVCAAAEGECWLFLEGLKSPMRFECGDVLVLSGMHALSIASDSRAVLRAKIAPIPQDENGDYTLGNGRDFVMIGGNVQIDTRRQPLLLSGLPPIIHIRRSMADTSNLRWLLDQIIEEMSPPTRPGGTMITESLSQALFVQAIRAYLDQSASSDASWLRALVDSQLSPAIARMHADPARSWSLSELAKHAGMSRTSFAVHFCDVLGVPPITYLTNWRMHLAERDLSEGMSISEIASSVGYASESAFRHAYKRATGIAPGRVRRARSKM
jgi:AraC-like DNA-binding protein